MSESTWTRWSQWTEQGMVGRGIMTKSEVQSELQRFEVKARKLLEETEADHVLYGRKIFDEAGKLEEVRFYLLPMSDERFDKDVATLRNQQVYALHRYTLPNVDESRWFAVTRWAPEDAIAAAEEQGVTLTLEQAAAWWERNERCFQNLLVERGNEILSEMNFKEEDGDGQG